MGTKQNIKTRSKKIKKTNPPDATMRNISALKKRVLNLEMLLKELLLKFCDAKVQFKTMKVRPSS